MNRTRSARLLWLVPLLVLAHGRTAGAQDEEQAAVLARVIPAVVTVLASDSQGSDTVQGSGFVVRADGLVITAWHVIAGASRVRVVLHNGAYFGVEGMLGGDRANDIALLKVNGSGLPVVPIGDSDAVQRGHRVHVLGSPQGLELTASDGIVSAPVRELPHLGLGGPVLQITAPISVGSSGGPVLNARGEAVGIARAFFKDGQNLNLAVPINLVKPLLAASGTVTTAFPPPDAPTLPRAPRATEEADLSGTYTGAALGTAGGRTFTFRMTLTVVRRGNAVSGTWWTTGQESGTVAGTVLESGTVALRVTRMYPCFSEFNGTASVEEGGARLRGLYVGPSCRGEPVTARFEVVRQ